MPRLLLSAILLCALVVVSSPGQAQLPTRKEPLRFGVIEIDPARVKYAYTDAWVETTGAGAAKKHRIEFRFEDTRSPKTTGGGVLANRKLNQERLAETADAVAEAYHDELVGKAKVIPGLIWIVAGAHFSAIPQDQQTELESSILTALRKRIPEGWEKADWEKTPIPFKILSSKEEFRAICYGLKDRNESIRDSVVTHIGLGLTHACYFEDNGGAKLNFRGIGYYTPVPGARSWTDGIRNKMADGKAVEADPKFREKFPEAIKKESADLANRIATSAAGVNGLEGRKTHLITGDLADALLVLVKPEALLQSGDQVEVTLKDIETLVSRVMGSKLENGAFQLPPPSYPEAAPSDVKAKIDDFYNKTIRDTMSAEELASATMILQSLSKQFQYEDKTKTLLILKDTQHGWSSGYLREAVEENLERAIRQQK
jgi:hypothetical protein